VLVRQYRPGPATLLTSLPGGFVDPHESPLEAGARELREETGYTATEMVYLTSTRAVSATNVQHVVAALGCVPGGEIRFDEFEECEVVVAELADFRGWLRDHPMGSREHSYLALDLMGLL
jgi:ADP-ribose pyrophosphatase